MKTKDDTDLNQAWDIYYQVFKRISDKLPSLTSLELENVAPKLLELRNCEVTMPGFYKSNKNLVKITEFAQFCQSLAVNSIPEKWLFMEVMKKSTSFAEGT